MLIEVCHSEPFIYIRIFNSTTVRHSGVYTPSVSHYHWQTQSWSTKTFRMYCNRCFVVYIRSLTAWKGNGKKTRPCARICGLRSSAKFQPREPPIQSQFFISNRRRFLLQAVKLATCTSTHQLAYTHWQRFWLVTSHERSKVAHANTVCYGCLHLYTAF